MAENLSEQQGGGGEPSPGHDTLGQAPADLESSVLEKIRSAGRGIFEKYGVKYRAGRGRPRADGDPKISDVPMDVAPTAIPVGGAPTGPNGHPSGRSGVVKRCYKSLAKAFSSWADKIIFRQVVELTGDKSYAKEVVLETALTDPEAEAFSELVDELAAMWGADEKFMALAAGFATVASVGGRYVVVIRGLDRQLEQKRSSSGKIQSHAPKP